MPGGQPGSPGRGPAEGDILEEGSRAAQEYEEFWQTYLPLLSPSGVELFSRETASSPYGGSPAHWTYHHSDSFWSSPELDLPDGVYEQTRVWLEGLAQEGCNPWQTEGLPARLADPCPHPRRWPLPAVLPCRLRGS